MTTVAPPATTAAPHSARPRRSAGSNERSPDTSSTPIASTSTLPNGNHLSGTAPTGSTPKSPPQHRFKVVLIGDAGVGKTSLRQRWLSEAFTLGYRATIGVDFISKVVEIDSGVNVSLSVWDTAGQDRFRALGASFYRGADACVLVYSDSQSLRSLQSWFDEFKAKAPVDDPLNFTWVAVRSKIDLDSNVEEGASQVAVGEEEDFLRTLLGPSEEDLEVEEGETVGCTVENSAGAAVPSPRKMTRRKVSTSSNATNWDSMKNKAITCCAEMPTRIDVLPPPSSISGGSRPSSPTRETASQVFRSPRGLSVQRHQMRASTSLKTIYHTSSSSFNESLDSLASDANTVTPSRRRGDPSSALIRSPSTLSEESDDVLGVMYNGLEMARENINSAEYERDMARGIDPFMASSPPHPPSHLVTIGKHLGGPSLFQKSEKMKLIEEERNRNERKMDVVPGGEVGGSAGPASVWLGGYSYGKDGIKLFRTSAKTGEGVADVFEYIAKRTTWQWHKDEKERKHQLEMGGPIVRLGPQPKGSKWREACCS